MPRKKNLSWTASKKRWRKSYGNKLYTVYCSELDLPKELWTELGSYQAANEWWVKKRAELDKTAGKPALPPETEELLARIEEKKAYSKREGLGKEADSYAEQQKEIIEDAKQGFFDHEPIDPKTLERKQLLEIIGGSVPEGIDPETLDLIFGSSSQWQDRQRRDRAVSLSKRLGTNLDSWYSLVHRRAKPSSIMNIRAYCTEFKDLRSENKVVLSGEMSVDDINEAKFKDVYTAISKQELDGATKKKKFCYFKAFLTYLSEMALIDLPKNFSSKQLVFSPTIKLKVKPVPSDIRAFFDTLPDRFKLYVLLALNCSMNNVDIANLLYIQIDMNSRTLTRKRVKTENQKNVPTVTYYLWNETLRLLQKEGHTEGLVLRGRKGEPLYITGKEGDKAQLYDKIKCQWREYFKRRPKPPYTMKDFRFFGGDLLDGFYLAYKQSFLGHAPQTQAEKSYSSSNCNVTEACKYLETLFYPELKEK